jgi:DNA-directed RNA polymerase subunit RPC12/RpoP
MRDGLSRLLHGGLQKPLQVRQAQVPDFPAQLLSDQAVDAGDADPAQVDESAVPSSPPDAVLAIPPIPAGPLSESAHSLGQEPPPLPPEEMARQFFRRVLTGESVTQEEQNRMEALGLAQEAVAKICAEVMADMAIQEFGSVESVRKCLGMLGPESESSAVVPPPLPSVPQPLGPSPKEIFQVLAPFAPHRDLFLSPDIPAKKLNNAGQACVVPNDEAIVCLIDCTVFGNAKNALLFGACAIYYHNDWTCTQRGRGVLPYAEFANRAFFKKSGSEVALGGDQFINRAGSSVAADTIVAMLNAIKNLLANREASGGTAAPQTEDPAVADEPGVSSEEVLRQTLRRLLPPGGATDAERTEVQRLCMEPSAPESAGRILREVEAELGIVHEGSKKMENVRLKCPACGKGLRVGEKLAGRESSCPACHARLLVSPDCRQLTQVPDGTRSAGRKTLPVACKLPESEESGSQTPVSVVSPRPPVPATATPDTVGCPHCSGGIANDPQYAGQEVGCPHCQGRVVMPDMTSVVPAEVVSESVEPGVLDFLQSDGSSGNAHQSADGDTTLARADRHYWAGEKFKAAPLYMDHMNECPDDAIASSRLAVCLAMMCSEAMSKGVPVDSEMSAMAFKALTQAWAFAPNDPIVLRNEYCVLRELGVLQDAIDESEEMAAKFDPSVFTPPDGPS